MTQYITKSKIMSGMRCPKQLWLQINQPSSSVPSKTSELTRNNGILVGGLARLDYPAGRLIEFVEEPARAIAETQKLITGQTVAPLFEAAFTYAGAMIRADILAPDAGGWHMIEVKSSGSVKPHHLVDCAIQLWVAEGSGLPVGKVSVAHVDTGFVYAGDENYTGILVEEDVTEQVKDLLPEVPAWLAQYKDVLDGPMPEVDMGSQCKPECQFEEFCQTRMPDYPVRILPNGRKLIDELMAAGFNDVRDIPEGVLKNERHILVRQATISQQPYVGDTLALELAKLPYPLFYLDFETINFVIPRWAGTRPHQQLPFQWSCHIEREQGQLEHRVNRPRNSRHLSA